MKRIFAVGLLAAIVALPAGAAAVSSEGERAQLEEKMSKIDWQPPKLSTEFEAQARPRVADASEARRLRQLELLQKQAEKAQARAAKLQKMREAEASS